VEIISDTQTKNGRMVLTRRIWSINGHAVTVLTTACINSRSTWGDRDASFSRVDYICECGREFFKHGAARKSELANHDNWYTAEQREQVRKALEV
jgi:hypothetical protein